MLAKSVLGKLFDEHSCSMLNNPSRNAMDNASKNAKDMIGSLRMKYNRGRQAAITNELVDIITGSCYHICFSSTRSDPPIGASAL
jgi:F-type H+-transporting ATPase subunit gamma